MNMSDFTQLFLVICVLFIFVFLARKLNAWKVKRAYFSIVRDIKAKKAFDANSAIDLAYARKPSFSVGMRDFRPIALEHLIQDNIVGVTDDGKFYLKDKTV
jgi:hypothetical protein